MTELWILVYGDLDGGVRHVIGPFRTEDAAIAWHVSESPWRSAMSGYDCCTKHLRLPEDAVYHPKLGDE